MKELNFSSKQGITCHYQAITNILQFYKCDLTEDDVFLLLRAFYQKNSDINIPYLCREALNKIGFNLIVHHFKNEIEFQQIIKESIEKEIPVIANVNGEMLSYFPDTTHYNLTQHMIVLYGYMKNRILIADVYVPYYPPESYRGYIDSTEIYKAVMKGNDSGRIFTIERNSFCEIRAIDIFNMTIFGILNILMNENKLRCLIIKKSNLNALQLDVNVLRENAKLTRLELLTNGGPVESRYFLANVFQNVCLLNNEDTYGKYAQEFRRYHTRWKDIANACMKYGLIGDVEIFKRVILDSFELAQEEIEFLKMVKNSLATCE